MDWEDALKTDSGNGLGGLVGLGKGNNQPAGRISYPYPCMHGFSTGYDNSQIHIRNIP